MRLVTAEQVHALLDYPFLIEALRRAHAGAPPRDQAMAAEDPTGRGNQFISLLGWRAGGPIAAKLVGVFPGNLSRDPPQDSVQGLVATFDPDTGAARLVADGAAMTFRKTAADSGLGTALLARPEAEVLLIVGAGGLAPHMLEAHRAARPALREVVIWNRTAARAGALAERLAAPGLSVRATQDLDGAVARADVISCVTMAREPLIRGALLKPGAHLDLVGAYLPEMAEADAACLTRGRVFADTRSGMEEAGELAREIAPGIPGWQRVEADFFDLVQGRHPGRQTAEEITVCKNVGGGALDLFAAEALEDRLAATGEG
ncbi:ornithine cyclodeaminase [Pseudooceanicola sp. GBMRC 2024]|uniref:Ornithine cyclodeaminase n=1 Tax=Pseudooceanicola albus TaxID=2692189 RepID=A0A6L7G0H3_9RHOB|nr:ornithine cyclodeaminase [Pseudooceanicola albus]MXN17834.1 ornithine cyclodeaminase [Pseudooceanicola albus]